MKIAFCSDELYPIHKAITQELEKRGHEVVTFGAIQSKREEPWWTVAKQAAEAVRDGICQEGIFCCWTGTGISMAANKVHGIRAALCTDAETAAGARTWNHANVLALSNRLLTPEILTEILGAWFDTPMDERGCAGVLGLLEMEK